METTSIKIIIRLNTIVSKKRERLRRKNKIKSLTKTLEIIFVSSLDTFTDYEQERNA